MMGLVNSITALGTTFGLNGRQALAASLAIDAAPEGLLDIGCKQGWLFDAVEARRRVGVDLNTRALQYVRPFAVAADALRLPFLSETFDVVTMFDVIEHLPMGSEGQALSEAKRTLVPNGRLILSTPAEWKPGRWSDPQWWVFGHRHYQASALRNLVAGTGLVVERLETVGGWADVVGLPFAFVAARLGWRMPKAWLRWTWRDYSRPGRYTHFVLARKIV
jgi:SAM-dependent methyltransferase